MSGDTASTAQAREPDDAADAAPGIDDSVRALRESGRGTVDSALETGRALRRLVSADLALARSALGRALAWVGVAVVFGVPAWLMVLALLIAILQASGWSWIAAIAIAIVVSGSVTALAVWRVMVFFDHAGMHATRRQLSKLGLFNEPGSADDEDDAPSTPAADRPGTTP